KEIFFNSLFGITLACAIVFLPVFISTRFGIDLAVFMRAVFGYRGVVVFIVATFFLTFGYEAINCQMFGNSMTKLASAAGLNLPGFATSVLGVVCALLGWWIALKGPEAVKRVNWVMVPCLILVAFVIIILVFKDHSISELMAFEPPSAGDYGGKLTTYMIVAEWNIAFGISWINAIGSLPKLSKSERGSYWAFVFGAGTVMSLFIFVGALTGLVMAQQTGTISSDPTEWLVTLGGPLLGTLSLVMIGMANVSTQAVILYVISLSTKVANPRWDYKKLVTFWTIYCSILVVWGGVWTYYGTFVSVVGVASGPILGLVLVDFFLLRKQKVSLYSLFKIKNNYSYEYTGGFNLAAVAALFIGIISFVAVYNPITYTPRSSIFYITTATGLAIVTTALSYYILGQITPIRNYILKDRGDKLAYIRNIADAVTTGVSTKA
ncbi:MAG: cytosine permease, partial [Dehalobacterium sp.]